MVCSPLSSHFPDLMRYHREGEVLRILDEKQLRDEKRWQSLTLKDKVGDWAARHEYSIILGGWAASLGLAGAIISRNKCVLSLPSCHLF
jgi:hypothetical protein